MDNTLYLMLSRTGTGMGRFIRLCTRGEYNHVSLSLDPSLRQWVSFARYRENVPLAGGFVEEPVERFLSAGKPVAVRIYAIPLPSDRIHALERLFSLAKEPDSGLIYNSFAAALSPLHIRFPISRAYTCLDFACAVLGLRCRSIQELASLLAPYLLYSGSLAELVPDSGLRPGTYFCHRSLYGCAWDTVAHFSRLTGRVFRPGAPDPVAGLRPLERQE